MPYTLLKFLLWAILFALVGGVIGWMLRSLRVRREVADAKASVDQDEVDRLRHRVESLEGVVAERDRLRIQVAELRGVESPGVVGVGVPDDEPVPPDAAASSRESSVDDASEQEVESVGDDEQVEGSGAEDAANALDESGDEPSEVPPADGEVGDAAEAGPGGPGGDGESAEVPSVEGAEEALGRSIEVDDLTVVEGIGPNIAELCRGIGIIGWHGLAATPVDELRSMLADAGSRYQVHDPTSWPRQAELLAAGRWAEFQALVDELDRGR